METLIHLLIVVIVLACLWWGAARLPLPEPGRWVAYAIVAIISLVALLPFLGIHLPAH